MPVRILTLTLLCLLTVRLFAQQAAAEPQISYKLDHRDGRVVVVASDGAVIPWSMHYMGHDIDITPHWIHKHATFVKAGNHLWQLSPWAKPGSRGFYSNPFWSLDGNPVVVPDYPTDLKHMVAALLEVDPQARFVIRTGIQPDPIWQMAHKEEFVALDGLPVEESKNLSVNPSLASDLYISGVARSIRDLVAYVEAQPWHNRVIGYTIFPLGEGLTEAACGGQLFDQSAPMQHAFARFVRDKYRTNEALRAAWNDPAITLDTVTAPTREEWEKKRDALHLLHWVDPSTVQRERDYFLLQEQLFTRYFNAIVDTLADATKGRPVIKGADLLKQPTSGWTLGPEFSGEWERDTTANFGNALLASGSINAVKLLDNPNLDMLQTPGIYFNRAVGYAWEAEGCVDSLTLRGKVNFMEADMRTWAALGQDDEYSERNLSLDAGAFRTPAEMDAGFDRTLAWAISRNQMYYYMSIHWQNRWFDDPIVAQKIRQQLPVIKTLDTHPWRETRDAVCMVLDDTSGLDEDFSTTYQHLAVFRQMQEGLALCGIPYRVHLLDDLRRPDFPKYKVYLFPNLFRLTPERLALLKDTVLRDGNVAIFGPGTGISDGAKLTADPASALLGVKMELTMKTSPRRVMFIDTGHPISRGLPTGIYTDEYAYGPLLLPADQRFLPEHTTARTLGTGFFYYGIDRPGLFVNDFGLGAANSGKKGVRGANDYAVVFSTAVPLPPELLRECARYAGCTVWSEQNAVVYACDNFVALHSVKGGAATIHLPRPCRVRDVYTGKVIAKRTDQITVDITPPATKMFWLE